MSMIRDLRAAVRPRPSLRIKDSGSYDTTRDPATPSAVVDCAVYRDGARVATRTPLTPQEAMRQVRRDGGFVWIGLHEPTEDESDQLLAARTLLEAEAARLAAEHATPEQVEQLWELHRNGEAALAAGDQEGLVAANASLHSHIVAMSRNKVLGDLIRSVDRRARWYYLPIALTRGKAGWNEHAELIEAIGVGNRDRSGDLMRRHTERTRQMYHQRRQKA